MPTKPNTKALKGLIVRLGQEPDLLQAYSNSPKEVMLGAGVPSKQIDTIMSGSKREIENLLGNAYFVSHIISTTKT